MPSSEEMTRGMNFQRLFFFFRFLWSRIRTFWCLCVYIETHTWEDPFLRIGSLLRRSRWAAVIKLPPSLDTVSEQRCKIKFAAMSFSPARGDTVIFAFNILLAPRPDEINCYQVTLDLNFTELLYWLKFIREVFLFFFFPHPYIVERFLFPRATAANQSTSSFLFFFSHIKYAGRAH